jgi:hypothetical protein
MTRSRPTPELFQTEHFDQIVIGRKVIMLTFEEFIR